jgi:transcriptional regulator with GAF, ATPase, and Fis domain
MSPEADVVAKLHAVSGPLRKSEFVLGDHVTIGRDSGNLIRLEDDAVSPRHCAIQSSDGRSVLTDLGSHSGTFVNGLPVKRRELRPADELAVGNTVFVFRVEEGRGIASSPVDLTERDAQDVVEIEFHAGDLFTLEPRRLAALPRPDRTARNLSALIYICKGIGFLRDEASLPWQLLSMILDIIPADRGAVLLMEEGSEEVCSQVGWDRVGGPGQPVPVSRAIVRRVIEKGVSLLDRGTGESKPESAGLAGPSNREPRRSLVCVPLLSKEKPIGLIYLESSSVATALTEDDFRLLTAMASLGAVGIESARQIERLGSENQRLRAEASLTHDMVGHSARMREIYQYLDRVAPTDATVLIHGESGTGKELVAVAIHKNSSRKNQPFVALNCAALTETLLESELFGHEKGAFTSAVNQKRGFLEVAEGGTIFLDEIGELSLILQAKLLRVLQEREFMRVGGTRPIKINVRFLAATNKDLQKCVREEKFRGDLFHRLNVISIALPPLRERREDIPALAEHFVVRHARKCNRNVTGISDQAMACLAQYDWPGNIRELENAMERAVVIGSAEKILAEDLPETIFESVKSGAAAAPAKYQEALRNLKKQMIVGALEQSGGSITDAAKLLGVHANYLHRLMRNLELRPGLKKRTAE